MTHESPTTTGLALDHDSRCVRHGSGSIEVTSTEFSLLQVLFARPGRVITREVLLAESDAYGSSLRNVDTVICRLLRRLGPHGARLETVRLRGYRLALADADPGLVVNPAA